MSNHLTPDTSCAIMFVYVLIDPRSSEMRYVGVSCDTNERLRSHSKVHRRPQRGYAQKWLAQLRNGGHRPEMEIIEAVLAEDIGEAEQFWISYFRGIGCPLTNTVPGGGLPPHDHVHTEEFRQARRASMIGNSYAKGNVLSADVRQRMGRSRTGMVFTDERRKRIAVKMRGNHNNPFGRRGK